MTHVRLNIFPDGGVARLRVHGDVVPDENIFRSEKEVDLAALENGYTPDSRAYDGPTTVAATPDGQ